MTAPSLFLLMNQSNNPQISIGDKINIDDAYGKEQFKIGFIRSCQVNGNSLKHLLPAIYARNLQKISPLRAKITGLKKDGADLIIQIKTA